MKRKNYLSWDTYFMSIAVLSSMRSKDKKTRNGACIADENKKVIGIGYNGLPRGMDDDNELFWRDNDSNPIESKHSYVVHAEVNAIYNKNQTNLENSTIYATSFPCRDCTKAIIQNGIKRIVYLYKKPHHQKINEAVELMCKSSGVEIISFYDEDINDKSFIEELENMDPIK